MKEYTMPDGTTAVIMDYEEWLTDAIHMTENEYRAKLGKRPKLCFETKYDSTEYAIERMRKRYREYFDRFYLDRMPLTFTEYLEAYAGHTPESFHEMCAGTGTSAKDESKWLAWIRNQWEEHENNIIPF